MQADPLLQTAYRDSALQEAVRQGKAHLVTRMVKGASPAALDDLQDSQHNNALHSAASVGRESEDAVQTMQALLAAEMSLDKPGANHLSNALRLQVEAVRCKSSL